jgi:adenylosuccinate lyase
VIERYTRAEMGALWTDRARFQSWLDVELAVCEVLAERGRIPPADMARLREKAAFDPARIAEIEAQVGHDVIAFLTDLGERVGPAARHVHHGLTSSDVVDTAQALRTVRAADLLLRGLRELQAVLRRRAEEHRRTVMVGRTHGIHAEPTTLGLKLAGWYAEARRNETRLAAAREDVRVGKLSGAVGTCAHLEPEIERAVLARLGLRAETVATQVVARDRHAALFCALGVLAASLERIAVEIRHLQRTEVAEVEEPFARDQKGSSSMPHKRNPVGCENLTGLARLVRGHVAAALENVALWHERDISHSSVERVILPDATILCDTMLARLTRILDGLVVHPGRMLENLGLTRGLIYSQNVLLALTEAGLSREAAYAVVQRSAMRAWAGEGDFRALLAADPELAAVLDGPRLEACFDPGRHLRQVDTIFGRVFDEGDA